MGLGDAACDLVIAWTLFDGASRAAFKAAVDQDSATWARARGWALWKALIGVARDIDGGGTGMTSDHALLHAVLTDDG